MKRRMEFIGLDDDGGMVFRDPVDMTGFLLARIKEDEARDRRRILFRTYHTRFTASRRQAVEIATSWLDMPVARDAGDKWLRGIAKNYRRHPDYRQEWKP